MPNPRKKSTKRVPLARKYNITKKAKEQERKTRRAARKNPNLRKKLRKDLGIPNLNPFKAQILKKLEEQQKQLKFVEAQRAKRAQAFAAKRRGAGADEGELAGMAANAAARGQEYADASAARAAAEDGSRELASNSHAGESTRRAFYRHVKALLEKADIILEVLDARDPLSCRAPAVEALALAQDPPKRIVLVLNKIDLVPPEVVRQWLQFLKREFPTVAFKANTQGQRDHLSAPAGAAVNKATEAGEVVTGSGAAGADTLLQLIKNYSRSRDMKTAVTVGVVGYPNVGKSSVINSLKRGRAVGVSSTPGFTKTLQEVALDGKITLIDCPGIIFDDDSAAASSEREGTAGLLLKNCISVDAIEDPEGAVDGILQRCAPDKLMALYGIGVYDSTPDFLAQVAVKRHKLAKGGVPDKNTAARLVLQDWNSGRIPFFVLPPAPDADDMQDDMGATASAPPPGKGAIRAASEDMGDAKFVTEWGKEFDYVSILKAQDDMLDAESAERAATGGVAASVANAKYARSKPQLRATSTDAMVAAASLIAEAHGDEDEEDDDDEDDEDEDGDEEDDDDDDMEEEDDEERAAPAAAVARKPQSSGRGVVPAKKAVKFASAAMSKRGAKSSAAEAYDFREHFK